MATTCTGCGASPAPPSPGTDHQGGFPVRTDGPKSWIRSKLDVAVAALAAHEARHDEVLTLLEELASEADDRNAVLWSTIARIEAARSAAALGLDTRVRELLETAAAGARSMGAGLLLEAIDGINDEDASATGS